MCSSDRHTQLWTRTLSFIRFISEGGKGVQSPHVFIQDFLQSLFEEGGESRIVTAQQLDFCLRLSQW